MAPIWRACVSKGERTGRSNDVLASRTRSGVWAASRFSSASAGSSTRRIRLLRIELCAPGRPKIWPGDQRSTMETARIGDMF